MIKIEELPNDPPVEDPIQKLQRKSTTKAASQEQSTLVHPKPGFVIKTTEATGRKVFINVCGAAEVDAVGDWAGGQMPASVSNALQQLGSSMDPAGNEALRFPLSVGERREDADHTGAPSYVVDAIFNADVIQVAAHVRQLKTFICNLLLEYVGSKLDMKLDTTYKLPRMRYKGAAGPQPQHIRAAPKQLITEVADDRSTSAPAFALRMDKPKANRGSGSRGSPPAVALAQTQQQTSLQQPPAPAPQPPQQQQSATVAAVSSDMSHTLDFEGSPVTAAHITVHSPALRGSRAGACSMSATHDTVTFRLDQQQLEVKLPFSIDAAKADATVYSDGHRLQVRLPFRSYTDILADERGGLNEIAAC